MSNLFRFSVPDNTDVPVLELRVNPNSLQLTWMKIVGSGKTLGAYVEAHWGNELSVASASGSTLGFFSYDPNDMLSVAKRFDSQADLMSLSAERKVYKEGQGGTDPGQLKVLMNGAPRRGTPDYKNFEDLLFLYKYNGADQMKSSGQVQDYQSILMAFDMGQFTGNFTSFNWRETEQMPYRFEYDFEFEIKKTMFKVRV